MHVEMIEELFQASWRPLPIDSVSQFGQTIPPAPTPHPSAQNVGATILAATPVKAPYRPPGARGLEASLAYKRNESSGSLSGQSTPARHNSPGPNGKRYVPGAAPKGSSPAPEGEKRGGGPGGKKKKGAKSVSGPFGSGQPRENGNVNGNGRGSIDIDGSGSRTPAETRSPVIDAEAAAALDAIAKKVRNLNKKLKAIDELKEKASRGERLEATQLKKIDTEAEIRKELAEITVA